MSGIFNDSRCRPQHKSTRSPDMNQAPNPIQTHRIRFTCIVLYCMRPRDWRIHKVDRDLLLRVHYPTKSAWGYTHYWLLASPILHFLYFQYFSSLPHWQGVGVYCFRVRGDYCGRPRGSDSLYPSTHTHPEPVAGFELSCVAG